jgi:hypothetical protein
MKEPHFLEELHRIREEMLAEHNGSLLELIKSLQKQQKKHSKRVISRRRVSTRRSTRKKAQTTRASNMV